MKEVLISLETAKLAKEKGFNEGCFYYYYDGKVIELREHNHLREHNSEMYCWSAPTQSLLQKWLREIHNLHIMIIPYNNKFIISLLFLDKNGSNTNFDEEYNTYELALEQGLIEGLKLIK